MSDSHTVSPPATSTWDVDAVAEGALTVLRLQSDDAIDSGRVAALATVACQRIDELVDRPQPPVEDPPLPPLAPTPKMVRAAIMLTGELYSGELAGVATLDDGAVNVGAVRLLVRPDRERWGIS